MQKKNFFFFFLIIFLMLILASSCGGAKTAQIWTDRPEFAFYGELFNSSQAQYKVSIKYYDNPALVLENANESADIIIGSWIKNASTGSYFKSVDNLFGASKLSREIFYPKLLAAGRIDRSQYLLPVSFNLPSLIFLKENELAISNSFTIDFDEIKNFSRQYNAITRGAYTRMGFSPLWDDNFLLIAAILMGASFRLHSTGAATPLAWDSAALENAMDFIYEWTCEINTSVQAEEEFTFKYFFEPPERLIQNERILFSYMDSRDLFKLSDEYKANLDYRWIIEKDMIPVNDDIVFLGIPKKAKSTKAAQAFIQWFFTAQNQRLILEYFISNRISENVFGICDGFSALTPVTEQVFTQFYPELLGRMPPSDSLLPPNVLPGNWADIKRRAILPYLHERARVSDPAEVYPLERRLSDWVRLNR